MIVLGINIRHGDSSACIIKNGKLLSAIEEERIIKLKHCSHFPINSIKFCLTENNIKMSQVDYITLNSDPKYNFFTKVLFFLKNFHKNFNYFDLSFLTKKTFIKENIELYFGKDHKYKILPVSHHLSHANSTMYFLEKNNNDLIFSFDGSGDFSTIEVFLIKENNEIKLIEKNNFPHSLGFFYSAFTQFLGFKNYGDEYKLMGLSGYGKPKYLEKISKIIESEYPFKLNLNYFNTPNINYIKHVPIIDKLYNENFVKIFGKPFKNVDENISQYQKDLAASVQKYFEDLTINYLIKIKNKFKSKKLYITGGCAFNSVLVGKIIEKKIFKKVNVGPNPGDAGGAIGSAFQVLLDNNYRISRKNLNISYLGPSYSNNYIRKNLLPFVMEKKNYDIKFYKNFDKITLLASKFIKKKKLIFWFQDNMEWGPRALGNRSILADPSNRDIINIINKKIKKRELFRPFAPAVLKEHADDYFYMNKTSSPFMNVVYKSKKITKKTCPAVVHVDNTSRVQTVAKQDNLKFYKLLKKFQKLTSYPILINTSLNVKGPIAMTPRDAFNYLAKTEAECLFINNWVITKNERKHKK